MSTNFEQAAVPLFGEVVDGYNQRMASGIAERESADLRRARQSAFEKFRLLGFPTIRHEDWKYTNLNRFLKEEYAVDAGAGGAGGEGASRSGAGSSGSGAGATGAAAVRLPAAAAAIPGLDAYRVVLVNGVWDGKVAGGPLPEGLELRRVAEALTDPAFVGYFENG